MEFGQRHGDVGDVAGHDNRVGRLGQVAELCNVLLRQSHVEGFDSTIILNGGGDLADALADFLWNVRGILVKPADGDPQ